MLKNLTIEPAKNERSFILAKWKYEIILPDHITVSHWEGSWGGISSSNCLYNDLVPHSVIEHNIQVLALRFGYTHTEACSINTYFDNVLYGPRSVIEDFILRSTLIANMAQNVVDRFHADTMEIHAIRDREHLERLSIVDQLIALNDRGD